MESGTKIGQSGPVKTFSSTAEAISAQIESDTTSLNSHVSVFILIFIFILIYLLHVLFVLKIEGIFGRKSQPKKA